MGLWRGQRVPMTLLGGYLGAGKTTIVNRVLADVLVRRVAVLVNDVGAVQVDAELVAERHDDTIELTNGCVCCSLVDGFAAALETLRSRPEPPDHVLVELSGVAEPARVAPWASTAGFRPDGIVIAADADQLPARAADPRLADLVAAQLGAADLVLITKTDLDHDRVALDELLDRHTRAPRVETVRGSVSPALVLGPLVSGTSDGGPRPGGGVDHEVSAVVPPVVEPDHLADVVRALPDDIVRAKGVVLTTDGPRLVQRVGRRVEVSEAEGLRTGPLVLIGLSAEAVDAAQSVLAAAASPAREDPAGTG